MVYNFLDISFQPTSVFTCRVHLLNTACNWTLIFKILIISEIILITAFSLITFNVIIYMNRLPFTIRFLFALSFFVPLLLFSCLVLDQLNSFQSFIVIYFGFKFLKNSFTKIQLTYNKLHFLKVHNLISSDICMYP